MTDRKQIRAEVMAQIVEDMRRDRANGLRPREEAVKRGIPLAVACEAEFELEEEDVESWWRQVERTIDGEIVGRAIEQTRQGKDPEAA
ncbi:hypothetical protein GVN24_27385 [Rhizobium sp. CRIBSB]|nr:hypothetical protein [Rhizobium sp. CRIBSB]